MWGGGRIRSTVKLAQSGVGKSRESRLTGLFFFFWSRRSQSSDVAYKGRKLRCSGNWSVSPVPPRDYPSSNVCTVLWAVLFELTRFRSFSPPSFFFAAVEIAAPRRAGKKTGEESLQREREREKDTLFIRKIPLYYLHLGDFQMGLKGLWKWDRKGGRERDNFPGMEWDKSWYCV